MPSGVLVQVQSRAPFQSKNPNHRLFWRFLFGVRPEPALVLLAQKLYLKENPPQQAEDLGKVT